MDHKSDNYSPLDRFDHKIIDILRVDGRISVAELARRVGLSKTPCQIRLKKIIANGYIRGFRAIVDHAMLGDGHIAFAEVKLSDTREPALRDFGDAVGKIKEVEECHMIAGNFDYLLKIRTKDIQAYRAVLGESISTLPHVASTSTFVVMEALVEEGEG